jgi:hypothetical protein
VRINRKINGMVMKDTSGDNSRDQEKNKMRKKSHKQKDKTRDEIVKLMLERPGVRPSDSRNVGGSRALPDLVTQLPTGMLDRYKWLVQFSLSCAALRAIQRSIPPVCSSSCLRRWR